METMESQGTRHQAPALAVGQFITDLISCSTEKYLSPVSCQQHQN